MSETLESDRQLPRPEAVVHTVGELALANEVNPAAERAAELASLIDPEGTLPQVEMVPNPTRMQSLGRGRLRSMDYVLAHQGEQIGTATLVTDLANKERWFNGVEVERRGQGFGMAAYKAVITDSVSQGFGFRTHDLSQTEGAKRVWESLEHKGVAREVTPFVRYQGDGKYLGHYVVDAVKP